jgi:hypothetical protein
MDSTSNLKRPKSWLLFFATSSVAFLIRVSNPFNLFPAWPASGISIAFLILNSLLTAYVLLAALQNRRLTKFDQKEVTPGGCVTLALSAMLLYFLFFDLCYAVWLRTGHGIYSKGHFERAWGLIAYGFFGVTLLRVIRNAPLHRPWNTALKIGGWIALCLTLIGFVEAITYGLASIGGGQFSETLEIVIIPILIGLGNLAFIAWAIGLGILYLLDFTSQRGFNRFHYVPPLFCVLNAILSIGSSIAFRISGNSY